MRLWWLFTNELGQFLSNHFDTAHDCLLFEFLMIWSAQSSAYVLCCVYVPAT